MQNVLSPSPAHGLSSVVDWLVIEGLEWDREVEREKGELILNQLGLIDDTSDTRLIEKTDKSDVKWYKGGGNDKANKDPLGMLNGSCKVELKTTFESPGGITFFLFGKPL